MSLFGDFEHHLQISVGYYIPNNRVMSNWDIYQPLFSIISGRPHTINDASQWGKVPWTAGVSTWNEVFWKIHHLVRGWSHDLPIRTSIYCILRCHMDDDRRNRERQVVYMSMLFPRKQDRPTFHLWRRLDYLTQNNEYKETLSKFGERGRLRSCHWQFYRVSMAGFLQ